MQVLAGPELAKEVAQGGSLCVAGTGSLVLNMQVPPGHPPLQVSQAPLCLMLETLELVTVRVRQQRRVKGRQEKARSKAHPPPGQNFLALKDSMFQVFGTR